MDSIFAQCVPIDESPLRRSSGYLNTSQTLQAARQFLDRYAPGVTADIDAYLGTCLELEELECRHYFAEGYRLGREGVPN